MPKEVWMKIITPITVKKDCCLIALSTLSHERNNFFNTLLDKKLGHVHRTVYACDACLAKGIAGQCLHRIDSTPHFNSEANRDIARQMFGSDNEDQFLIENLGLTPKDMSPEVFAKDKILKIFSNPRVPSPPLVRYLFVAVDPCAGSDISTARLSDFAVMILSSPSNVILGMDAIDAVAPRDYQDRLVSLIHRARQLPGCALARIVLDVENGTGFEAGHIHTLVQQNFPDVVVMDNCARKPGMKMTEVLKREMAELTRLFVDEGNIGIHRDLVTTHSDPEAMLTEFRDQLLRYSRIVKENPNGSNRVLYSGKGPNKRLRDDMAIVLQRALYARYAFTREVKYSRFYL